MKYGACAQFNAYCGSEAEINIQSCIIRKEKVQVCNLSLMIIVLVCQVCLQTVLSPNDFKCCTLVWPWCALNKTCLLC